MVLETLYQSCGRLIILVCLVFQTRMFKHTLNYTTLGRGTGNYPLIVKRECDRHCTQPLRLLT